MRTPLGLVRMCTLPQGGTPVWTIWPETVSGEGRSHLRDEARLQLGHGGTEIFGSMRVLPYMDPALRARRGAAVRVAEERAKVRMTRRAHGVGPEAERGSCGGTSAPEGGLREGYPGIHNGGYESDRDRMGREPRRRGRQSVSDPIRREGPQ